MSETVKVSRYTKESLVRVAAMLQAKTGKRVDLDEAIGYLLQARARRPELLEKAYGALPQLRVEDLYQERRKDEQRTARRHGS